MAGGTAAGTESESETESESGAESESETESKSGAESETESKSGAEAASGTESESGPEAGASLRRRAGAYAALVRLPNLFTAPPDVVLGAALVAAGTEAVDPIALGGLAVASILLYAGGTTLNDAFDAPDDARARPERPIPSGWVTRRGAFVVGGACLALGVVVAFLAGGGRSGLVAALLAFTIVLYDGVTKDGPVGFLTMGTARGLNVVLGTTAAAVPLAVLPSAELPLAELPLAVLSVAELPVSAAVVPIAVAVYIAAVTYMAAHETGGGTARPVAVAGGGALVAVATLGVHLVVTEPPFLEVAAAVALAAGFLWWVGRPLRVAYGDPVPENVGPAVGACVLGLVILAAAFAAASGLGWAATALVFLAPAWGLSAAFDVT